MSEPAICCVTTPTFDSTAPARPAMRILRPFKSATVLISLRNQPPICTPVLPLGNEMMFDLAKNSFISLVPLPSRYQALVCRTFMPNGIAVSMQYVGSLPK